MLFFDNHIIIQRNEFRLTIGGILIINLIIDNIYKCDEEEEYSINTLREDGSLAVRLSVKVMVEGSFGAAGMKL